MGKIICQALFCQDQTSFYYRHVDRDLLRTLFMLGDSLKPYLENIFGFKLILHERDFPGGVTIIENIIQAVSRSRRMIVLLTR